MQTKQNTRVLTDSPDGPRWLTIAQLLALPAGESSPVPDPAPTKPAPTTEPVPLVPFGPRTLEGTKAGRNIYSVVVGSDFFVLDQIGTAPDAFAVRGGNLVFDRLPGRTGSLGKWTGWSGLEEPAGFPKPDGYRFRQFPNNEGRYYQQSSLPDELAEDTTASQNTGGDIINNWNNTHTAPTVA